MKKKFKHLQTFEQSTDKNLNISDVMKSLSIEEQEMVEKGKKHWNLVKTMFHNGYRYI